MNCHGCKWLDENKKMRAGNGYCCMVERSRTFIPNHGDKVRTTYSERCELFEEGNFEKRFEK